ncbi:M48 family metallopeptidase [Demequina sp. SO4-13]|uniref:M48 family metallopeptidase n=1 Tax=Demequina sp. SO4-13 TaxID=3401027 RepID=UPI003AF785AB
MSRDQAEYRPETRPVYTLIRKKMRNIRLRVDVPSGELRVSAPHSTPVWRIDAFVASKRDWIAKRRAEIARRPPRLEHGYEAELCRMDLDEWLDELMPAWCERFDIVPPHVSLRIMKSQWGSCRAMTRRITLNIELARRGYDLAEYVLVHELCHLFELNHGPRFYALMDHHLPDWRERRRRLGPL